MTLASDYYSRTRVTGTSERHRKRRDDLARSKTRNTCRISTRENQEIPKPPTTDGVAGRAGKASGREPAMHGRGEVGPIRSTDEVAEQCWPCGCGGDGGKGSGQGEHEGAKRAPDSEPGQRAQCAQSCTSKSKGTQRRTVHGTLSPC